MHSASPRPAVVATSQGADQLGDLAALTDGYSAASVGAAGIAMVGALLAAVLLRVPKKLGALVDERELVAA